MGIIAHMAKNAFKKVFERLALDLQVPVDQVKIGICFDSSGAKYEAYKLNTKEKDIEFSDYLGAVSTGGGTIEATIGQAGPKYAQELTDKLKKPVVTTDISIIMKHTPDGFPMAALMAFGERQRMIDIEKEFLTS